MSSFRVRKTMCTAPNTLVIIALPVLLVMLATAAEGSGPRFVEAGDFADRFEDRTTLPRGVGEVVGEITDGSDADFFRLPVQITPRFPIITDFPIRLERPASGDGVLSFRVLDDSSNTTGFANLRPGESVDITGSALSPNPADRTIHFATLLVSRGGVPGSGGYSVHFSPAPIPEPTSALLLGVVVGTLGLAARRDRRPVA